MRKIEGLKIRNIAGENLIIKKSDNVVDMTRVIEFNDSALYIWEELGDAEFSNDDVAELLSSHYHIDASKAKIDAGKLIDSMLKAGLIEM